MTKNLIKSDKPYHLKKTRLSTYQATFAKLKTEFLHYKWIVDTNVEDINSREVRKDLEKVSKLLFTIEREFEKHKGDK